MGRVRHWGPWSKSMRRGTARRKGASACPCRSSTPRLKPCGVSSTVAAAMASRGAPGRSIHWSKAGPGGVPFGGEGLAQLGPAGHPEQVVLVEAANAGKEGGVPQPAAQHVEGHQGLAVAHGLARLAVAAAEFGEGEVPFRRYMVGVTLQAVAPVVGPMPRLFLEQVVGEVGGEPLGPVALGVVDIDAVAPPVMQDFVGKGAVDDEGEADDPAAQQGEGGHAVAALPEALHQGELGVGVGADERG
jgi:hypothetical protein